ncbi:MAG TPA: helix-turn-helix domain-containing protein [Baekduia sp.]|uniref:PucR family transcriptional regulator n=1 Tax=Baekduia sp. TaxID=2600305 RepID=UPI002BD26CCD|nr:helix-turn-helix domain-containing protein [Baekduia sp.]HMJ37381.1 helix-turn-helix domain-containing protein [Baekduia sp.]
MEHEPTTELHHEALNELARRLRADLAALVDETEGRLHREQPDLVARVDAAVMREGIAVTHERFIALLDGGAPDERDRHIAFGAAMAAAGVSVDALLAGYRVGAQVGWRHTARFAAELDVPSAAVLALATASMAFMDELAANSLEGFAHEAAAVGGARARERQALLDALVAGRADDTSGLARAARWPLPESLRVAVLLGRSVDRLDDRVLLLGHADGTPLAIAREDGDGASALLDAGVALAAGPAVPPEQAPLSLARARRVAALTVAGVLPADRALVWEDHLADLMLHADAAAGEVLVARRLEPLTGLPPARERLLRETLAAWLEHPGRPREIARMLHLHHQTVRYRLARLRERFGDDLDDPGARFELALALRVAGPPAR